MNNRPQAGQVTAIVALLVATPFGRPAELPSLERGLVNQAPALLAHFKARGCKNVGVLKFLIAREGDRKRGFSDNVGTLNMLLARRLEVALVLANDPRAPLGIIRNASVVAARTSGANHLKPAGRRKLFDPDYPLAWGKKEVRADGFVTGTAEISADLRTLKVGLLVFDRASNKLVPLGKDFDAQNDGAKLAEMNESFLLRGLFDDGKVLQVAAAVKEEKAKHPLLVASAPVSLEILYDDTPVKIEYREGKAFVPEPREGQKVAFRLRRDRSKVRYGAVLKVNGENTIERQRGPDLRCRRWIFDANDPPTLIEGYQIGKSDAEKFRVLSRVESKAREVHYGADVGTISLTVFRERQKEETPDPLEEKEKRNARIVAQARLPQKKDFATLKAGLLAEANDGETRGLIGKGEKVKSPVKVVPFDPDPLPLMSATVIYYRPSR